MSDSTGWIYDPNGIDVALVKQIKEVERGRISEYAKRREGVEYKDGRGVWSIPVDIALPCWLKTGFTPRRCSPAHQRITA